MRGESGETILPKRGIAIVANAGIPAGAGAARPVLLVRFDRPFFFLLRHNPTGLILFMGRVTDTST